MSDIQELREFNEECIAAHNNLRQLHGARPIRYNEELALAAQRYAEKLADMNTIEHSSADERGGEYIGENLAFETAPYIYSGRGASIHWYSEIEDYDFDRENQMSTKDTGHFTQLVWSSTEEAGFGRASVPSGKSNTWYIVGRYNPGGNVTGLFRENVSPLEQYRDWNEVAEAQEYLEEMKYYEFTGARRHIMDEYMCQVSSKTKGNTKKFVVLEKFVTPNGEQYEETKEFDEDPRLEEKPAYKAGMENYFNDDFKNIYNDDSNDHHDIMVERRDSSRSRSFSSDDDNASVNLAQLTYDTSIQQFIEDIVVGHNTYRTLHGLKNLKLDINLSKFAQDWAETMASEAQISFSEYKFRGSQIGENICVKPVPLVSQLGRKVVSNWYKEANDYYYGEEPENFPKIGHFTQVIWRKTKKIGVGIAECQASNVYFIVCFYYPPGNVSGQFMRNINRPL